MESLLWSAALIFAIWYGVGFAGREGESWRATVVKTASTALLAVLAWWLEQPAALFLGLGFGAVGDFALSRPGSTWFLAGMGAFAVGHGAYVGAFAPLAIGEAQTVVVAATIPVMIALLLVTAFWIAPRAGALCWPVRAYAVVIAVMAVTASAIGPVNTRWLIHLGVAAFVASDLILAIRLFIISDKGQQRVASHVLWPLYWGGQALILLGFAAR